MSEPSGEMGWCNLCVPPQRLPIEEILMHLRVEHDLDAEIATWPDGQFVIVDETLEPSDFDE